MVWAASGGGAEHGGGRGPGAGAGPSPVTSCRVAGAEAAPQRLRRRSQLLAGLPFPLTLGSAAPAFFAVLRLILPAVPSSSPFFLLSLLASAATAQTAGRGASSGQQPGEAAGRAWRGPRGSSGRELVGGGWGLGFDGPTRPASFPGPPARGAFPEEADPPAPPASGRRAAWTPDTPNPSALAGA